MSIVVRLYHSHLGELKEQWKEFAEENKMDITGSTERRWTSQPRPNCSVVCTQLAISLLVPLSVVKHTYRALSFYLYLSNHTIFWPFIHPTSCDSLVILCVFRILYSDVVQEVGMEKRKGKNMDLAFVMAFQLRMHVLIWILYLILWSYLHFTDDEIKAQKD